MYLRIAVKYRFSMKNQTTEIKIRLYIPQYFIGKLFSSVKIEIFLSNVNWQDFSHRRHWMENLMLVEELDIDFH